MFKLFSFGFKSKLIACKNEKGKMAMKINKCLLIDNRTNPKLFYSLWIYFAFRVQDIFYIS